MWYVACYFWNFLNHTLHATEGPRKLEIIDLINKRVTCYLKKVFIGLSIRCHFLFPTSIHTLISCPIRKRLSCLEDTSSARWYFWPHPSIRILLNTDKLILLRISMGRMIPYLSQIDEDPPLRITIVTCSPRSLYIERENDPNTLSQYNHYMSLDQAWDSR